MTDHVHHYGGASKVSTQGMREIRTAAATLLGTVKEIGHGKEIVYAKLSTAAASTSVLVGYVMVGPNLVANHGRVAVAVTASIGAREVILSLGATSAVENAYAQGHLVVECGTGSGYSYLILGHQAWAASNSAAKVFLADGLEVALTTASLCTLVPNPYNNVYTKPDSGTTTGRPVGVTLTSAALTNGGYVWLGKKGHFPALVSGTLVVGNACVAGSPAGTVGVAAAATEAMIGRVVGSAGAAGGYAMIDFTL